MSQNVRLTDEQAYEVKTALSVRRDNLRDIERKEGANCSRKMLASLRESIADCEAVIAELGEAGS